jgi:hypothetical protein
VVQDRANGRLLAEEDATAFSEALAWVAHLSPRDRRKLKTAVQATAERFSLLNCTHRLVKVYEAVLTRHRRLVRDIDDSPWARSLRWLEKELAIVSNLAGAVSLAVIDEEP